MMGRLSVPVSRFLSYCACLLLVTFTGCQQNPLVVGARELRIVSYDATRELFRDLNQAFAAQRQRERRSEVAIRMSHNGSGKQARAVMDGLEADIVSLALAWDIDSISAGSGKIRADWQSTYPNESCPFTSTVVFLVREGNPKGIRDWPDLVRSDVSVLTPNPKSSGGARWNHLAAWAWAMRAFEGDEARARVWMSELYARVPVFNAAARGSLTTLVRAGVGDVLLAWEHEARLALDDVGSGRFEIVYPSLSILAEPPVAIVDEQVDRRGTRAIAEEYMEFLYSPEGQEIFARHYFRPLNEAVARQYPERFPAVTLVKLTELYPTWAEAQRIHFADGGLYDQLQGAAAEANR
jgi:sulfate transport system substrate-binding protein